MSAAPVVPLHGEAHRSAQSLLPWYAGGTLSGEEAREVEAHLADCPRCQADLALERRLHQALLADAALAPEDDEAALQHGLARLHARMEADSPGARLRARWASAQAALAGLGRPLLWRAIALQGLLVVVLATALVAQPPSVPAYRGLGSAPPAAAANVLVMFRAEATEAALRTALQAAGAQLAGGPTAAGAYLLAVEPARRDAALLALRAQPAVALAELVERPPGPPR